jgi:hypothetical protein
MCPATRVACRVRGWARTVLRVTGGRVLLRREDRRGLGRQLWAWRAGGRHQGAVIRARGSFFRRGTYRDAAPSEGCPLFNGIQLIELYRRE